MLFGTFKGRNKEMALLHATPVDVVEVGHSGGMDQSGKLMCKLIVEASVIERDHH